MEENRNNRAVERRIKDALKNDRARIQVGRISHFGLLEMSRQRLRPGFTEGTFRTCPHCEGRGIVRSISSCGLGVLRSIDDYLQNKRAENITVKCAREVVYYLLNEKRDSLLALEQNYNVTIFVVPGGEDMRGTQSVIERATDREHTPRRVVAVAPVQIDSALGESDQTTDVEDLTEDFQDEASETVVADSTDDGERKHNGRRRRRRGRRGGQGRGDERRNEAVRSDDTSPTSEVSSVGEESGVAELEAERQDVSDQTGDGEEGQQPATDENSGGQDEERRGRREGRGRGRGRGRGKFGRGRDRRDGDDAGPQRERAPRDHSADSEVTAAGAPIVEKVTTVPNVTIPEIAPSPEPRKWQPPAATVGTVPAARKAGWWSKRKSE
jgi:ribonuclease E